MKQKKRVKVRAEIPFLSITIKNNDNEISGQALNISSSGVAVKCSTFDRDQITPKGDYICEGKPLVVNLVLSLSENKKNTYALKAKCRVVYSRRLTQDECQLGMNFLEMDAAGKEHLMKFVESYD